jgi:hypothetical protein
VDVIDANQLNLLNPKLEGNRSVHDHRERSRHFVFDHCYLSINPNDYNYANQKIVTYER